MRDLTTWLAGLRDPMLVTIGGSENGTIDREAPERAGISRTVFCPGRTFSLSEADNPLHAKRGADTSLSWAIRAEASQLLANPCFKNSPVLARLLIYLVNETVNGRGDLLKSYSVAVDGLGRPPDFDAKSDSYPRVQLSRLRKALETYYARHGSIDAHCLYIQPGSYRMRMANLATAYPGLYRPLSDQTTMAVSGPGIITGTNDVSQSDAAQVNWRLRHWILAHRGLSLTIASVALLTLVGCATWLNREWLVASPANGPPTVLTSPVVDLLPVASSSAPLSKDMARTAQALLVDGLSRSWLFMVRTPSRATSKARPQAAYRLESQIDDGDTVFFRLIDGASSTLVWSTTIRLSSPAQLEEALAPVIAQLGGPYGVIAADQTRRHQGDFSPGYGCVLQYLSFLVSRNPAVQSKLSQCLDQPSPEFRLESTRLAVRAFYMMEAENVGIERQRALDLAMTIARQAIENNPQDAYAQFAFARISFLKDDCEAGLRHADLAAANNPFDPIILGVLGALASQCGDGNGLAMLDRAYRFRVDGESYARFALIWASIQLGQRERLSTLSEVREPRYGTSIAYYYLCETLISAALDRQSEAAEHWKRFVAASPKGSLDAMLRHIVFSDTMRASVAQFLIDKGVVRDNPVEKGTGRTL